MTSDEELKEKLWKKERKYDEEKRKRFLKEYEKQKKAESHTPIAERLSARVKGGLTKQNVIAGARKAGSAVQGGIKKAATYKIPEKLVEQLESVRDELEETGESFPRMAVYDRPRRRSRKSRRYVEEAYRSQSQKEQDYFSGASIASYADSFSPPAFRMTWTGQQRQTRYDTDEINEARANAEIFENPFEEYLSSFDPFARKKGEKRKKSDDMILRWFT